MEKLTANDATPGLHIEPIVNSADPRVRTGRVDDNYRAVMFKLSGSGEARIYGDKITLSKFGIAIRGRSRRLTLNYRTTAKNLGFAMSVLSGGDYSDLEGEAEDHGYRSLRPGLDPVELGCTTLTEAYDRAAELVTEWKAQVDDSSERIAILVRNNSRRSDVVSALAERGLQVRGVERDLPRASGKPLVMTMHRAKGLEFTHVLLFDVGASSIPRVLNEYRTSQSDHDDAMLRERSLLYVAATRARDVLGLIWTGERSPLLNHLG